MVSGTIAWSSGSDTVDELDDEPTVLRTPITDIGCAGDVDRLADRVAEAEQLLRPWWRRARPRRPGWPGRGCR